MSRRLGVASSKAIADQSGREMVLRHFQKIHKNAPQGVVLSEKYAEMLEAIVEYRDLLITHKIGEFKQSQKEKVAKTARLVGLEVPSANDDLVDKKD